MNDNKHLIGVYGMLKSNKMGSIQNRFRDENLVYLGVTHIYARLYLIPSVYWKRFDITVNMPVAILNPGSKKLVQVELWQLKNTMDLLSIHTGEVKAGYTATLTETTDQYIKEIIVWVYNPLRLPDNAIEVTSGVF